MGFMHNADWGSKAQKFKDHCYQVKGDSENSDKEILNSFQKDALRDFENL